MSRSIPPASTRTCKRFALGFALAAVSSIPAFGSLVACDKTGAEAQAEATKAQEQANQQQAQSNDKVTTTGAQVQTEADKKIIAAQADFATTREDYRHKMQSNIDSINKQLDDLGVKARSSTKPDLTTTVHALRQQRDAFQMDFQSLGNATASTFDGTKARLDKEWNDLKTAVDKAE